MQRKLLFLILGLLAASTLLIAFGGPPGVDPKGTWQLQDIEFQDGTFNPTGSGTMTVTNDGPGPILASIKENGGIVVGPFEILPGGSKDMPMSSGQILHLEDVEEGQGQGSSGTWGWN